MNTESASNGPRPGIPSFIFHDFVELEVLEYKPPPPTTTVRKGYTVVMLEPMELELEDVVPSDAATALRLTVQFAPDAESVGCRRELVDLLHALNDFDLFLGGRGLVLDSSLSESAAGSLSVLLRPLDAHRTADRFTQMAAALGGPTASSTNEPAPGRLNGDCIAEVITLYESQRQVEPELARDRVQNWRGRQKWMAGLQVELVPAKAD